MATPSFRTEMIFDYGQPRELAPGIVRIVANNPGPFTFKGTNTYVLGHDRLTIVDPGPDDANHIEAIGAYVAGRPVDRILVTHTHRDHIDALPAMAQATGAEICGFGRSVETQDPRLLSPTGREFVDATFAPDRALVDGDQLDCGGVRVEVIHTPGHAPDHLCFALPDLRTLLSGDHVMGWNTTVVAPPEGNMRAYLASLERLAVASAFDTFLPGHGGRIFEPKRIARAYLVHRRLREQAILDAIRAGHASSAAIVGLIYEKLDPNLVRAAQMSVLAHIEHLADQGLVVLDGPISLETRAVAA